MKNINHIVTGKSHEGIEQINIPDAEEKGGFFDLPLPKRCNDPRHDPPMHLYIPQGKGYIHICPTCGRKATLIPTQISL